MALWVLGTSPDEQSKINSGFKLPSTRRGDGLGEGGLDSGDFDLLLLLAALSGIEPSRGVEDSKLGMCRSDFELGDVLLGVALESEVAEAVPVAVVLATACARQERIRARGNRGDECCVVVVGMRNGNENGSQFWLERERVRRGRGKSIINGRLNKKI